jgi:hypothetical protein
VCAYACSYKQAQTQTHTWQVRQWGRLTGALAVLSPDPPASSPSCQPILEPWDRVAPDPSLAARVLWARPKPPARAVEKAHRRYCGEAERVLDCCRQTLLFARPEGLRRCLRAIAADPDASLVRVRTRLLPCGGGGPPSQPPSAAARGARSERGWPAAGEVVVNLRLGGGAAVRLGLEGHVCELRLVLAELQCPAPARPKAFHCPQRPPLLLQSAPIYCMFMLALLGCAVPSVTGRQKVEKEKAAILLLTWWRQHALQRACAELCLLLLNCCQC